MYNGHFDVVFLDNLIYSLIQRFAMSRHKFDWCRFEKVHALFLELLIRHILNCFPVHVLALFFQFVISYFLFFFLFFWSRLFINFLFSLFFEGDLIINCLLDLSLLDLQTILLVLDQDLSLLLNRLFLMFNLCYDFLEIITRLLLSFLYHHLFFILEVQQLLLVIILSFLLGLSFKILLHSFGFSNLNLFQVISFS